MKLRFLVGLAIGIGLPGVLLLRNSRAATESPKYRVARSDWPFEIRDYPAMTLATTSMGQGQSNKSFGKLFRFITGNNANSAKVPMTAPVLIDPAPDGGTMSFIMPAVAVEHGVPEPKAPDVRLEKRVPTRFVAMRFQGRRNPKNEQAAREKLNAWLQKEKMTAQGEPIFAYYDPPWTPAPLRRNEILVPISH